MPSDPPALPPFTAALRALMNKHLLTARQIAILTGTSANTIYNWTQGTRPRPLALDRLTVRLAESGVPQGEVQALKDAYHGTRQGFTIFDVGMVASPPEIISSAGTYLALASPGTKPFQRSRQIPQPVAAPARPFVLPARALISKHTRPPMPNVLVPSRSPFTDGCNAISAASSRQSSESRIPIPRLQLSSPITRYSCHQTLQIWTYQVPGLSALGFPNR
jgi:hypothetical protein